jgi:hypothetical protein
MVDFYDILGHSPKGFVMV